MDFHGRGAPVGATHLKYSYDFDIFGPPYFCGISLPGHSRLFTIQLSPNAMWIISNPAELTAAESHPLMSQVSVNSNPLIETDTHTHTHR